jgi:hypothetical protein
MANFRIFASSDLAEEAPIGALSVGDDGNVAAQLNPNSPLAEQLQSALDTVRREESLDLQVEDRPDTTSGSGREFRMQAVRVGDPGYAMAFVARLARAGFLCVDQGS